MKYIELQDKNLIELQQLLKDKKSELFTLKVQLKTMQLTKTNKISATRKDIAKISTAISLKKSQDSSK